MASAQKAEAEESALRHAARGPFGDGGRSAAGGQGWHFSFFVCLHGHLLLPVLDRDSLYFSLGEVLSAAALRCAFKYGFFSFPFPDDTF